MGSQQRLAALYGDHDAIQHEIVEGLARTLWVLQWADHETSVGRSYPGHDLEAVAPDTPEEAYTAAGRLITAIERMSLAQRMFLRDPTTIAGLYRQAIESRADCPYRFGAMLAHHHQGTGRRWEDDHERSWAFELPCLRVALEEVAAEADPPNLSQPRRAGRERASSRSACASRLGPACARRVQEVVARRRRRRAAPAKGGREKHHLARRRRVRGADQAAPTRQRPTPPRSSGCRR